MRFLKFILSHSVFISCCAAALCYQTNVLLHIPHDKNMYGFIFFSTLCSYNFYWLLSKFYFSRRRFDLLFFKKEVTFFLLFASAAAGMVFFIIPLIDIILYVAFAGFLTVIYSLPLWSFKFSKKLQKAGFIKTLLLAFTWAYVTTVLPAAHFPAEDLFPAVALLCARFFFMLLLCIIFDMRDASADKILGLHSLATDLSRNRLGFIISFVFLFYFVAGLLLRYYFHDNEQMAAFVLTGIIVWLVYRSSLKRNGYIFYYFLVDGLMLISALGTYIAAQF